jgi:hypothetical protein
MNLSEFKAWFEGFTDNLDGPPGPKAWEKICARVKEIKADPTPWPQFIREYVPAYPRWWHSGGWSYLGNMNSSSAGAHGRMQLAAQAMQCADAPSHVNSVTPHDAFRSIGRLDAITLANGEDSHA